MPTISGVHYMKMKSGERGQPISKFLLGPKKYVGQMLAHSCNFAGSLMYQVFHKIQYPRLVCEFHFDFKMIYSK